MFLRRLEDEEKPSLKGANMSAIQPVYELFSQNIDSLDRLHKMLSISVFEQKQLLLFTISRLS